jgi:hypothetical protein
MVPRPNEECLAMPRLAALALALALAAPAAAQAPPADPNSWALLPESFPSSGGGGWVIGEYRPQLLLDRCVTGFTATSPDGQVFRNIVVFRAREAFGGILCEDAHWAANDRSASGTTPIRVFIRDGAVRGFVPAE